jgi:ribosomal protein S18 acetylase RimI-like enzyme
MSFEIRALCEADRAWVRQLLQEHWGATVVVSRGRLHHADRLPGFLAVCDGVPVGLLTWHIDGDQLEVVTLNSLKERQGIGTALLYAAQEAARTAHCRRLWLITTNDNVPAIEFYKRRGLVVTAIHQGAIDVSRQLKPQIPERGIGGVPIHDEIEFALPIEPADV